MGYDGHGGGSRCLHSPDKLLLTLSQAQTDPPSADWSTEKGLGAAGANALTLSHTGHGG